MCPTLACFLALACLLLTDRDRALWQAKCENVPTVTSGGKTVPGFEYQNGADVSTFLIPDGGVGGKCAGYEWK